MAKTFVKATAGLVVSYYILSVAYRLGVIRGKSEKGEV